MHYRPFIIRAALALSLAAAAFAQNQAALSPVPRAQFFDSSGRPLAGGCVQTFQAGSTTPLASYTDATGTTANPNPVILDSSGRADIWLRFSVAYKITVRAKTTGCVGGGGAVLYTTDNVIDLGNSFAQTAAAGSLAIGLTATPVAGVGGGVGTGNARFSATPTGVYVSVNGGAPAQLTPGSLTTSIQFNNSGSFGGSSNFVWNTSTNQATITGGTSAGYQAPAFSSSNTGTNVAFTTAGGTFQVQGNGNGLFQNLSVTAVFNSLATGTTAAVQQNTGTFVINGNGNAFFQSVCTYSSNPSANTCNGSVPVAGTMQGSGLIADTLGATITHTTLNYGIHETDTGGSCNIGTTYTGGIGCTSDARLKERVRDLPAALAGVVALRPVAFDWTRNKEHAIGFIAQDVQKVFPDLVKSESDGYLSLSYMGLIPEMVKAIQELNARLATLEGRRR